jgi:hypothetical protein
VVVTFVTPEKWPSWKLTRHCAAGLSLSALVRLAIGGISGACGEIKGNGKGACLKKAAATKASHNRAACLSADRH